MIPPSAESKMITTPSTEFAGAVDARENLEKSDAANSSLEVALVSFAFAEIACTV